MTSNFSKLSRWAVRLAWAFLAIKLALLLVVYLWSYTSLLDGSYDRWMAPEETLGSFFALKLSYLGIVGFILTYTVCGLWVYHAAAHAARLDPHPLRISATGAIGWYFVPIAWYFLPYKATRHYWNTSQGRRIEEPTPLYIKAWWVCWVCEAPARVVYKRVNDQVETSSDANEAFVFYVIVFAITATATVLFIRLMKEVTIGLERQLHA